MSSATLFMFVFHNFQHHRFLDGENYQRERHRLFILKTSSHGDTALLLLMMLTAVCLATSAGVPAVGAGAADRLSRSDGSPRRLPAEGTNA